MTAFEAGFHAGGKIGGMIGGEDPDLTPKGFLETNDPWSFDPRETKNIKEKNKYNDTMEIFIGDIELFYNAGTRSTNDAINKKREKIICELGNNNISTEWLSNEKWQILDHEISRVIESLKPENFTNYTFICKGGRGKNYDLELTFYNNITELKKYKLEFKYGANEINDCPQWVSPMKPSQYFDRSYEELFYDEYLPRLCERYEENIPNKETYMKDIHHNKPDCTTILKEKYNKGNKKHNSTSLYTGEQCDIDNYNFAKQLNNESIRHFLETATLNVEKMNQYFKDTQKDKIYLLWNEGSFNIRTRNEEDYQINSEPLTRKNNNSLRGKTISGYPIKILLRWKNGVALPALQISSPRITD